MYREGRGKRREGKSERARACERVCVFYLVHRTIHGRGIVGYSVGTRRGHGIGEDVVDFNGYARGQRYTRVGGGEGMCVARVGSWFFDFFRIEDELSSLHELGYIYIWLCIFGKLAVSKVIPFFDTSVASLSSQLHAKPCCLYHASRELACFMLCLQGEFRFHVAAFIERDNKRRIIKVRMLFRVLYEVWYWRCATFWKISRSWRTWNKSIDWRKSTNNDWTCCYSRLNLLKNVGIEN